MKKKLSSKPAFFNPHALIGFGLCSIGLLLGLLAYTSYLGASALAQGPTTEVKGTIEVKGAKIGGVGVRAAKCGDLSVSAVSKEYRGIEPRWQRHASATGTWASGSCSYTVKVVANSEFHVLVFGGPCDSFSTLVTTPAQSDWFKLAPGDTKEQNFTVTEIDCSTG
jgi:hypothetical protein